MVCQSSGRGGHQHLLQRRVQGDAGHAPLTKAARDAVWRGTLAVVVSACCFGSISPLTVIATDRGMALESIQTWRYLTSSLLVLAYGWLVRRGAPPPTPPAGALPWYHPRVMLVAGGGQAIVATLALAARQLSLIPNRSCRPITRCKCGWWSTHKNKK